MLGDSATGKIPSSQVVDTPKASPNQLDGPELDDDEDIVSKDQSGPLISVPPCDGGPSHTSPNYASSPPSYADITRKKQAVSSGSSYDDSIEQLSKKAGRKSKKEV